MKPNDRNFRNSDELPRLLQASKPQQACLENGDSPREHVSSSAAETCASQTIRAPTPGVAPEAIEEVLGKPLRSFDSGEGYRELRYANSSCSVETMNGLLASLRIQSDPYYFEE